MTTQEAWPLIRSTGSVSPNPSNHPVIKKWEYTPYFRQNSHVSLCDLRAVGESDLKIALDRYFFLDPWSGNPDPVFLILSPSSVNAIVTYGEAIGDATEAGQVIVPFIEAGYPGNLPLAEITDVLIVDIDRPPPDPRTLALQDLGGTEDSPMPPRRRVHRCSAKPGRDEF